MEDAFTGEYLGYIAELNGDESGRRAAWERMGQGTAFYRGLPCAFSYIPRLFGADTRRRFEEIAQTTYGILVKVLEHYRCDPAYRDEFRFDERVEELVLLPTSHAEPLPVARIDFAFDEATGDFRFIEFNTDSSSGMNEAREALAAVSRTEPFRRFAANHAVEDDVRRQLEGWVETFVQLRADSAVVAAGASDGAGFAGVSDGAAAGASDGVAAAARRPQVAIVACLDSPQPEIGELSVFRELFEQAGMECSVFDVRQLEFDGEHLLGRRALDGPSNVVIDCVWRFCIVVDLLEHWDDVRPFIEAVRQRKVEMIGGFSTQVVHDKQLFAVLRRPATQAFLTPEERAFVAAHIPVTMFLDDPELDVAELKAHPEKWVIKPTDWYASTNVAAGPDYDPQVWSALVDERIAQKTYQGVSPFIAQEFYEPFATSVVPLYGDEGDFTAAPQKFGNLMGAYLYAGKFAGVYVRQGPHSVIGSARKGLVAPVLWVCD